MSSARDETCRQVLACPMGGNDADAATIREYLIKLLEGMWKEREDFNGKRPFGNSGWHYDLYKALGQNDLIQVTFDEDGFLEDFVTDDEQRRADALIGNAIRYLGRDTSAT